MCEPKRYENRNKKKRENEGEEKNKENERKICCVHTGQTKVKGK